MNNTGVYRNNFGGYVVKRVLIAVVTLFLISLFIFSIIYLFAYPSAIIIGHPDFTQSDYERIAKDMNERYGRDTPFVVQYFSFIGDIFTGDWGESLMPASYYAE
ncbi:MAG: hypothetical protein PVG61_00200 [Dehalococcoidia bacterium]|jgi:ABC-type dipeptide/oligopeptide/nickel transport system permease component